MSEEEPGSGFLLDVFVCVKLSAIVSSNRVKPESRGLDHMNRPLVGFFFCSIPQLTNQYVPGFSFQQCDNAMSVAATHNGINLPVAFVSPGIDDLRSVVDHSFTREAAPRFIEISAFTALFG